jgi:hypothetical protein
MRTVNAVTPTAEASSRASIQVDLYAEYAPDQLLPFLRISNNYSFEKVWLRPSHGKTVDSLY